MLTDQFRNRRKPVRSGGNGGNCVQLGITGERTIGVSDTKDPRPVYLTVDIADWARFVANI